MRVLSTISALICCLPLTAQTVYESLVTLDKSYNPLFGKEVAKISIDLIKQYELTGGDTSFHVMIQVNQKTTEEVGHSIGLSLFSSNLLGGASASGGINYQYIKESGVILMGYKELSLLYDAFIKLTHS